MASVDASLFASEQHFTKFDKAPNALRTISEASDQLDIPQHVLRFWETKFPQIKPLKRNGGRRFYRPQDLDVLQQIKHLLYDQGYTIKGAKKAVDEFIHARAERGVTHQEWMDELPPANVNDNVEPSFASAHHDTQAALVELAQALREPALQSPQAVAVTAPELREELAELRDQVARARDVLKLRLLAAAV